MPTISPSDLRRELEQKGLPDYAMLAAPEALASCQALFDELLAEVKQDFEVLCALDSAKASFATVVEPYFSSGETLQIFWLWLSEYHKTDGNEVTTRLMETMQPQIVRFSDQQLLDERFYHLLETIHRDEKTLDAAQIRSVELLLRDRRIAGVHLPSDTKKRLQEINEKLTQLSEAFSRNTVEARKLFFYRFTNAEDVKDFPEQDREAAAAEAKSRGLEGWVFTLSPPSRLAVMRYCADPAVREVFLREGLTVATKSPHDNRPMILEILSLRKEKASLLGFPDFTGYVLQSRIAQTSAEVMEMINRLGDAYRAKAEQDIAELKEFAGRELNMWDVSYEANKLMKKKFSFDEQELQNYFELEASLTGMFEICNRLFGLEMRPVIQPSYHPTIRSYEVFRNGQHIAYFILDLFARPTKRAGAWCMYMRQGKKLSEGGRVLPIIINVSNFPQGADGKPTLLSHLDLTTMFHEFGHGLHQLLNVAPYPNLESFATELDFIELPSQMLENWCWEKTSLALFARHVKTGELLPDSMLDALKSKRAFLSGYKGCEQLHYASEDMAFHMRPVPASVSELDAFCLAHEREWSVIAVPDYYKVHASFNHVFEGDYAVGYYSYTWSELLEADAFTVFLNEGLLNPQVGEKYRELVLSPGAMKPGKELFETFMGRTLDPSALLRKKGII